MLPMWKMQFLEFVRTRARPAQCSPLAQFPACIPLLLLHHSVANTWMQCRASPQLPSLPSPAPNFCQLCPSLHCWAQAGILIRGYTHSFSPTNSTENLTAPPCQADKKLSTIKRGSKLPRSFFALKCQRYLAIFTFISPKVSWLQGARVTHSWGPASPFLCEYFIMGFWGCTSNTD